MRVEVGMTLQGVFVMRDVWSEERFEPSFKEIFRKAPLGMLICRVGGGFIQANSAFYSLLGYVADQAPVFMYQDIVHPDELERELQLLRSIQCGEIHPEMTTLRLLRKDGMVITVERHITVIPSSTVTPGYIIMQVVGVTEQRQIDNTIRFMAFHDSLTGLGNRLQFQEKLASSLLQAKRDHTGIAIVFLDLDRFKLINDTMGHQAGDQALQEISRRLIMSVRKSDFVARFGGDEFIILLPTIISREDVDRVALKIVQAIEQPLTIATCQFTLHASVGVALFPQDGLDADSLIQAADKAMYERKRG